MVKLVCQIMGFKCLLLLQLQFCCADGLLEVVEEKATEGFGYFIVSVHVVTMILILLFIRDYLLPVTMKLKKFSTEFCV